MFDKLFGRTKDISIKEVLFQIVDVFAKRHEDSEQRITYLELRVKDLQDQLLILSNRRVDPHISFKEKLRQRRGR